MGVAVAGHDRGDGAVSAIKFSRPHAPTLGVVPGQRRETAFDCCDRVGLAVGRCGA